MNHDYISRLYVILAHFCRIRHTYCLRSKDGICLDETLNMNVRLRAYRFCYDLRNSIRMRVARRGQACPWHRHLLAALIPRGSHLPWPFPVEFTTIFSHRLGISTERIARKQAPQGASRPRVRSLLSREGLIGLVASALALKVASLDRRPLLSPRRPRESGDFSFGLTPSFQIVATFRS